MGYKLHRGDRGALAIMQLFRHPAKPLDAERPDGHDGKKYSYSTDGPAGQVSRTIRFRSIDHAVAPLVHGRSPLD